MMTKLLSICLLFLFIGKSNPNNEDYLTAMENALRLQADNETFESYQESAWALDRLAAANPSEWEPPFHACFAYLRMSFKKRGTDVQEEYLEKALASLKEAKNRGMNDESEYKSMMAYYYQGYISVSPKLRGARYVSTATNLMEEAMELNPENPRPYLLLGLQLYHTPRIFGGGKDKGCPYLKEAKQKYASFQPNSSIAPNWGYDDVMKYLPDCD